MTVKEVAKYLKVKEKNTYKLVAEGKISRFKVGCGWRLKRAVMKPGLSGK